MDSMQADSQRIITVTIDKRKGKLDKMNVNATTSSIYVPRNLSSNCNIEYKSTGWSASSTCENFGILPATQTLGLKLQNRYLMQGTQTLTFRL